LGGATAATGTDDDRPTGDYVWPAGCLRLDQEVR
jgi:hypothetical protein